MRRFAAIPVHFVKCAYSMFARSVFFQMDRRRGRFENTCIEHMTTECKRCVEHHYECNDLPHCNALSSCESISCKAQLV